MKRIRSLVLLAFLGAPIDAEASGTFELQLERVWPTRDLPELNSAVAKFQPMWAVAMSAMWAASPSIELGLRASLSPDSELDGQDLTDDVGAEQSYDGPVIVRSTIETRMNRSDRHGATQFGVGVGLVVMNGEDNVGCLSYGGNPCQSVVEYSNHESFLVRASLGRRGLPSMRRLGLELQDYIYWARDSTQHDVALGVSWLFG